MENVLIKFSTESGGLDEANQKLATLNKTEKELIARMKELETQKNTAKFYAKNADEQAKAEQNFGKQIAETQKQLSNNKKSIDELSKAQKSMTNTIAEGTTQMKSARGRLAEMREELIRMSEAGKSGSKEFNELTKKAGELDDAMKDVRKQVADTGSDTRGFDAIAESARLVAGSMAIAQGAVGLFGGENKDLEKTMLKVQSVISMSIGLQEVANMLTKEKIVYQKIATLQTKAAAAAEVLLAEGTTSATIAGKAFNLVAKANPYVLIALAITTVVGALFLFSSGTDDATEKQKDLGNAVDELNGKLDYQSRLMKSLGKSDVDIAKWKYDQLKGFGVKTEEDAKNLNKAFQDLQIARLEEDKKNADKKIEEDKKLTDKQKEEAKRRAAELHRIEKELAKATVEAMDEGTFKKLAQLELEHKEKMDSIKGYSESENELRLTYEKIYIKERDKLTGTHKLDSLAQKKAETLDLAKITEDGGKLMKVTTDKLDEDEMKRFEAKKAVDDEMIARKKDLANRSVEIAFSAAEMIFQNDVNKAQMDLDNMSKYYTTDAEEAKKNRNLKLITQQEYDKKEGILKDKVKKAEKEQKKAAILMEAAKAAFSITMEALKLTANPLTLPLAPLAWAQLPLVAVSSALQIANINKYAKGRKGGGGEMAWVGEQGPEIMYVPDGASIVPAHKSNKLADAVGIMREFNIPLSPNISDKQIAEIGNGKGIDYDLLALKIGKEMGKNIRIPKSNSTIVNVDHSGVSVTEGNTTTHYLNKKYSGDV